MKQSTVIYGAGHSVRPLSHLLGLLTANGIGTVVDVRSVELRWCWSPQYSGPSLQKSLAAVGIDYLHAPLLGGRDPQPPDVLAATLEGVIRMSKPAVCLLCSEGKHQDCHRHYLLAPVLVEMGYTYLQIGQDGTLTRDEGLSQRDWLIWTRLGYLR